MFSCDNHQDVTTRKFMLHTGVVCRLDIEKATMPLYALENGIMKQCGSAVLLEIADKQFMLTAAHTFDLCTMRKLHVYVTNAIHGEKLIPFDQIELRTSKTNDPYYRTDDPFDVCIAELPKEMVESIRRGKRFLHLSEIDPFDSLHPQSWYCALGYPSVMNTPSGKTVTSNACVYNTFIYMGERGNLERYDREVEIILDFDQTHNTDDDGKKGELTEPSGMSGCGIWRLAHAGCSMTGWKPVHIRLIGIQHGRNKDVLVLRGTRLRYHLQLIYRAYEGLRPIMEMHFGDRAKLL